MVDEKIRLKTCLKVKFRRCKQMGINLREKDASEMTISELVYNDCYVKNRQAMYRNYDMDCSARKVIRNIYKDKQIHEAPDFWTDDNYFDEVMFDNLQYGFENDLGILAILYQQLWSKADMREVLLNVSKSWDINALI